MKGSRGQQMESLSQSDAEESGALIHADGQRVSSANCGDALACQHTGNPLICQHSTAKAAAPHDSMAVLSAPTDVCPLAGRGFQPKIVTAPDVAHMERSPVQSREHGQRGVDQEGVDGIVSENNLEGVTADVALVCDPARKELDGDTAGKWGRSTGMDEDPCYLECWRKRPPALGGGGDPSGIATGEARKRRRKAMLSRRLPHGMGSVDLGHANAEGREQEKCLAGACLHGGKDVCINGEDERGAESREDKREGERKEEMREEGREGIWGGRRSEVKEEMRQVIVLGTDSSGNDSQGKHSKVLGSSEIPDAVLGTAVVDHTSDVTRIRVKALDGIGEARGAVTGQKGEMRSSADGHGEIMSLPADQGNRLAWGSKGKRGVSDSPALGCGQPFQRGPGKGEEANGYMREEQEEGSRELGVGKEGSRAEGVEEGRQRAALRGEVRKQ